MTTIAYKSGVMAGDTRETGDGAISPARCQKVFKLPDGSLFGFAGTVEEGHILLQHVLSGSPNPPELKHVTGLHVHPDGSVWRFEREVWVPLDTPFYALGSGEQAALVAMRYGADPATAVKTAMEFDAYTGGEVMSVALDPAKPKKKRSTRKRAKA